MDKIINFDDTLRQPAQFLLENTDCCQSAQMGHLETKHISVVKGGEDAL